MSLRAELDEWEKSRPTLIRSLKRPARSESLYRLGYPGSCFNRITTSNWDEQMKDVRLAAHMWRLAAATDGTERLQPFHACASEVLIILIIGSLLLSICFQVTSREQ